MHRRLRPPALRAAAAAAAIAAVALAALAGGPGAALAQPAPPEPAPPALRGTPYVVRDGAGRVRLYVRLDRALGRRFDGELRAAAVIGGRFSSLAPVAGRRGAPCYTAGVRLDRSPPGGLVAVAVVIDGPPPATLSALLALRAARPGDERGAPLGC